MNTEQESQEPRGTATAPADYRASVMTAYTLVFLCIIVYLIVSHRRAAKLAEDLEHLEGRLRRLVPPRV